MKRKIIEINENKCNGCGLCIDICAEAALEIVDGKAKLVSDFYCDGMGACLDVCPEDALKIIEKEVAEYDPKKTYEHVKKQRGEKAAAQVHGISEQHSGVKHEDAHSLACGCPGTFMKDFREKGETRESKVAVDSELRQWPIQLHLLNPHAPYFKGVDLIISADCVAFAFANFHEQFLQGKILIMFCPKLDNGLDIYEEKLKAIFKEQKIKSITTVKMEVPCCGGVEHIVDRAVSEAKKDIPIKNHTISITGEII